MKDKLKYLVPTAAVTSLFLAGCGDDDGATVDACAGATGTEALLAGSWTLTKEDGVATQEQFLKMTSETLPTHWFINLMWRRL